jgi:hypothetical protein
MTRKIFQRYQDQQKKKAIGMLRAVIKKIEDGEFIVDGHGFWRTDVSERLIFRVTVISRDSNQDSANFNQYS